MLHPLASIIVKEEDAMVQEVPLSSAIFYYVPLKAMHEKKRSMLHTFLKKGNVKLVHDRQVRNRPF